METRHKFEGTAEELRLALIREVRQRIDMVPNYGDTFVARSRKAAEQETLESLLHFLEHLDVKP